MHWWLKRGRRWGAAGVLAGCLAGLALAQQPAPGTKVDKFRLPQYDADGRLKSQILGDTATFREDGKLDITNVRIEIFKDGVKEATLWAAACVYDRQARCVTSDTAVLLTRENLVISGVGMRWDQDRGLAQILDQAQLRLTNSRLWLKHVQH